MSLGYAEKLSYRDDLGGQLGAPEIFDEAEAACCKCPTACRHGEQCCFMPDAVDFCDPAVTESSVMPLADPGKQGGDSLHRSRNLNSMWHSRLQVREALPRAHSFRHA